MSDRLIRRALRERFLFTLHDGKAFLGILIEADSKTYRVGSAWAITEHSRKEVDGELFLPRHEVIFLQRAGSGS